MNTRTGVVFSFAALSVKRWRAAQLPVGSGASKAAGRKRKKGGKNSASGEGELAPLQGKAVHDEMIAAGLEQYATTTTQVEVESRWSRCVFCIKGESTGPIRDETESELPASMANDETVCGETTLSSPILPSRDGYIGDDLAWAVLFGQDEREESP